MINLPLEDMVECKHCKLKLKSEALLGKHHRIYATFTCPKCNVRICDKRKLAKHIASHCKFPYQCSKCLRGFRDVEKYRLHCDNSHPVVPKKTEAVVVAVAKLTNQGSKKSFECQSCEEVFKCRFTLMKHKRTVCGAQLTDTTTNQQQTEATTEQQEIDSATAEQQQTDSSITEEQQTDSNTTEQQQADTATTEHQKDTATAEQQHKDTATAEQQQTDTTAATSEANDTTTTSEASKGTTKPSSCTICQRHFTSGERLKQHMELHRIESRECKTCEECFEMDDKDTSHTCSGTPNVQYVYKDNKLRCRVRSSREKLRPIVGSKHHVRKLGGKKSDVCVQCVQGFRNRDDFYEHIKSRTCTYLKNNGQCVMCKKTFESEENLQTHIMTCFKESLSSLVQPKQKHSKQGKFKWVETNFAESFWL